MKKLLLAFLIAAVYLPRHTFATHAMGADIQYQCLGNNQYLITVSLYRDCSGILAPQSLTLEYFSQSCSTALQTISLAHIDSMEVTPLCPAYLNATTCSGGTYPGVEQYVYSDTLTLSSQCPDWVIGIRECCRNGLTTLATPESYQLYAYATINNVNICNNSPVFTNLPVPFYCAQIPASYFHGAIDVDGDSLVYSLLQPMDDFMTFVPFSPGFSIIYPLSTTSGTFGFDPVTGQLSFTPDMQQSGVLAVMVEEYRNGILVGTTMRDIQITVLDASLCSGDTATLHPPSNLSGGSLSSDGTILACPNTPLSFDIVIDYDSTSTLNFGSNASQLISGSTFSVSTGPTSATGTFTWTPSMTDAGMHTFFAFYSIATCPVGQRISAPVKIHVIGESIPGVDSLVYCGTPLHLRALGSSPVWTPATGLSDPSISNPIATPATPTWYYVSTACNIDSVFIDVQPAFTLDAGTDTTICLNGSFQLSPTVDPTYAPYNYSWSPAVSLSDPDIANPLAAPKVSTTYLLTATSALGCIKTDSVEITISNIMQPAYASASSSTVCMGEPVQLSLSAGTATCDVASAPCTALLNLDYTLGAGTTATGVGTPYEGFWEDGRVQYLFRASELHALGFNGGLITGISFMVTDKQSTSPYNGFTIKMGCTPLNGLTGFIDGLTVVQSPAPYSSVLGWNNHLFPLGYEWDGVSNLLVEVCFDNTAFTGDDDVAYTNTSFYSVAYDNNDGAAGCNLTGPTVGPQRPNIRFSTCNRQPDNVSVMWSPAGSVSDATAVNPIAEIFGTTTFTATYTNSNGCIGMDQVTVVVDSTVYIEAFPDTSICAPAPVQLSARVFGNTSYMQLNCGSTGTPCGFNADTLVIGTAGSVTGIVNPFKGSFHDGKIQFLYTAAELNALGGTDRIFNHLALNVAIKNSTAAFNNFTIKMGCTGLEHFSNGIFADSLFVVYGPTSVITTTGWNTFQFDTPYEWDGESNVIIQICYNNTAFVGDDVIEYTPGFARNVTIYAHADFASGCALTMGTLSTGRPNIRLGYCFPPVQSDFTYSWSPAAGLSDAQIINPVAFPDTTTKYILTVSGGICDVVEHVTVNVGLNLNVFQTNHVCDQSNTAIAVAHPVAGTPPYSFNWSTGSTSTAQLADTLYNLAEGNYGITAVDAAGCVDSSSVTVLTESMLSVSLNAFLNCYGDSNGMALTTISGGIPPYSFEWSNGITRSGTLADTLTNLRAGVYSVIINDSAGCPDTATVTLTPHSHIIINTITQNLNCYQDSSGSASATVSGGMMPHNYLWSNAQATPAINGLSVGTYFLTVVDDINCRTVDTITINEPAAVQIAAIAVTDAGCSTCNNGSVQISASGGTPPYQFALDSLNYQSDSIFSSVAPAVYPVSVRDANGCVANDFVTVSFFNGNPDIDGEINFEVYPNPASDQIMVSLQLAPEEQFTLSIRSILGVELYSNVNPMQNAAGEIISISTFPSGVYFIAVETNSQQAYRKFVIER